MSFLFVAGGVALVALALSYMRPGRFGTTVLAMGAGYLLAGLWADTLRGYEFVQSLPLTPHDAAFSLLVLAPGLLVLLLSSKQKSYVPRIVAALAIAILAVAQLLPMLEAGSYGREVYAILQQYRDFIITGILAFGLVDVLFSRPLKAPRRKKDSE